jgi:uncharacterized protein (DUF697 family)
MVLSIARIYGFQITLGRAKELIATIGVGLIARTIFQQLSKLGGVPGWVLSDAIAASPTVAIGYAATIWFAYGEKPTQEALQRMVADITKYLRDQMTGLGEKRPDRTTIRKRIISRPLTSFLARCAQGTQTLKAQARVRVRLRTWNTGAFPRLWGFLVPVRL